MTAIETAAFCAFEKQLKTLCLREFPCGSGSWRETDKKNKSKLYDKDKASKQFSVTLRDYGANYEKTEVLDEFVNSSFSPWHLDYSWSEEAKELRQLSVKSPWLIDDKFVLDYFKTLRIVDKNVAEVDPNLLRFSNLKELTLSVNLLTTVNSRNLPSSLEVLELCANQISDLSSLCVHPPEKLHHLGLGYNRIQFIGDYLTGDYWPNVLSLDLSHNNLSDLLDVVRKLSSLPKLRNLVLQGNPLSLIAGYRGYTIDSLRKITVLDDIMISADEKHHYKGLARRREYILDEAKITLDVSYVKGIPVPDEVKNPEDQPEYPIIERRYFIQFMFLEDSGGKGDVFQITHGDMGYSMDTESDKNQHCAETPSECDRPARSFTGSSPLHTDKNVNFTEELQIRKQSIPCLVLEPQDRPATPNQGRRISVEVDEYGNPRLPLCEINTEKMPWGEDLEMNWSQVVVRDDLLALRNFIKQGMEFSVIEQVVLCTPPEEQEVAPSPSASRKGKDDKGKDKKKDDKKDAKGGKDDKKKKKKDAELDLKRSPPSYTTLATFKVPLIDFLEGDYIFESVFTKGNVEIAASTARSSDTDHSKKDGTKKVKEEKKKPASPKKKDQPKEKDKKPAQDKKGKDDKKDAKGKGKTAPVEEEGSTSPPPPLEVKIGVRLHHWKTAMDSLKEEEEKLKSMQEQQQQ